MNINAYNKVNLKKFLAQVNFMNAFIESLTTPI